MTIAMVSCGLASSMATVARAADTRGYELVSPVDKNGGDIVGNGFTADAAAGGDAIAYGARGSFGDTIGSGVVGVTQYVARRGATGWTSTAVTPTPQYDAPDAFAGVTELLTFSDDLRRTVVWAYDLPAVAGEVPLTPNIYSEDTLTRELRLVTAPLAGPVPFFNMVIDAAIPNGAGVSRDSRHIGFKAISRLLPEAPQGVPSVYEWDDGTLRLASILPDGRPAAEGAVLGSPTGAPRTYRETVSPDGTRVMFLSPPEGGQIYARVDHTRTVWVSQPETSGVAVVPENVVLQQVTGDSRHVIFSTTSRLLDGDTNDGGDLYLYTDTDDPASDSNLTLLTTSADIPSAPIVIGSSDHANRIFYSNGSEMVLWAGGVTKVVASGVNPGFWGSILGPDLLFSVAASTPGAARVTPDGGHLAFWTRSVVASGGPNPVIGSSNGFAAMYVYSAAKDQLFCASCPADGAATADVPIEPNATDTFPKLLLPGSRPSFLASDGRVFFSTAEPLVSEDVNGVTDVYAFNASTGEASLVSTGKGSEPAAFMDASESGDDVFIVTRQRLRKADRDSLADLYDARLGPILPDSPDPPEPCVGDACQPSSTGEPGEPAIGTLAIDGVPGRAAGAGSLRVERPRRILGWRGSLRVAVPSSGAIRWTGRGAQSGSRTAPADGRYRIRVALTQRARGTLARRGFLRVKLRLTFVPVEGPASTATVRLSFERSSPTKGR